MMADLLLASIAIVLLTSARAEYDVKMMCQLVEPGIKLPSQETCLKYYTCLGKDMVDTKYCDEGYVFDRDVQSCVPESESNCYYGIANPCHNKNNEFSYCSNGCNWYNWCINGQIAANGTCPPGQKFYLGNRSCIYGECETNSQSNIRDMCDLMPEGVFFGDFQDCRGWHKCISMNQESGLCEGSLVYNVITGQCLEMKDDMCQRTNNVVKGQASGPPQESCNDVNQVVADLNVCSLYYVCVKADQNSVVPYRWEQRSCKTQYYDVISQSCSETSLARPYPGCDRCALKARYSGTYWANAVDPNCMQYYTCKNGQRSADVRSCKAYHFFDEPAQACVGTEERFTEYVANYGACQDYTCTDTRECSMVTTGGGNIIDPPVNNGTAADASQNNGANPKPPTINNDGQSNNDGNVTPVVTPKAGDQAETTPKNDANGAENDPAKQPAGGATQ